jgi:hypothetical protein
MKAVLDNLLAVLPPLVAIVQHIDIASGLEAEPGLPHLPPHLRRPPFLRHRSRSLPPVHPATTCVRPISSTLKSHSS